MRLYYNQTDSYILMWPPSPCARLANRERQCSEWQSLYCPSRQVSEFPIFLKMASVGSERGFPHSFFNENIIFSKNLLGLGQCRTLLARGVLWGNRERKRREGGKEGQRKL